LDTSTVFSIAALIVSALALPMSYFVATKQVRIGLDEFDMRRKRKARKQAADQLDEFISLFFSAAKVHSGFDFMKDRDLEKLKPKIAEIDAEVAKTKTLDRLTISLNELLDSAAIDESDELGSRVRGARIAISQGSLPPSIWVTLRLCEICQGNELAKRLRANN